MQLFKRILEMGKRKCAIAALEKISNGQMSTKESVKDGDSKQSQRKRGRSIKTENVDLKKAKSSDEAATDVSIRNEDAGNSKGKGRPRKKIPLQDSTNKVKIKTEIDPSLKDGKELTVKTKLRSSATFEVINDDKENIAPLDEKNQVEKAKKSSSNKKTRKKAKTNSKSTTNESPIEVLDTTKLKSNKNSVKGISKGRRKRLASIKRDKLIETAEEILIQSIFNELEQSLDIELPQELDLSVESECFSPEKPLNRTYETINPFRCLPKINPTYD